MPFFFHSIKTFWFKNTEKCKQNVEKYCYFSRLKFMSGTNVVIEIYWIFYWRVNSYYDHLAKLSLALVLIMYTISFNLIFLFYFYCFAEKKSMERRCINEIRRFFPSFWWFSIDWGKYKKISRNNIPFFQKLIFLSWNLYF